MYTLDAILAELNAPDATCVVVDADDAGITARYREFSVRIPLAEAEALIEAGAHDGNDLASQDRRCGVCDVEIAHEWCSSTGWLGSMTMAFPVPHRGPCGLPCAGSPQSMPPGLRHLMHQRENCTMCKAVAKTT